jgi:hypothetical protein
MDKSQTDTVDHIEKPTHEGTGEIDYEDRVRRGSVARDTATEHDLTFMDVLKHHKMLIWWSFYFAMCAVGWYVLQFRFISNLNILADNTEGVLMLKSTEP